MDEAGAPPLELSDALVEKVRAALAVGDTSAAAALAAPLHAADLADLLERLDGEARRALIAALGPAFDADTLPHLDEYVRDQVIEALGPEATGEVVARLETDDAVEVLADLDEAEQAAILAGLPLPERAAIEQGLAFPEYSAGRLMQRDAVAVPEYWTVGQTIDYLRAQPDLPDEFYDIFLIDPRFRVVGAVPLSRVLRSRRAVPLKELRLKELRTFPAECDQEEVARAFRKYGLVSAPVVGADGRLLGVITVDDVVDVIEEEAEDDILKLGGVLETDFFAGPWQSARQRLPWLVVNLATAVLAATVIGLFEGAIEKLVALAVLMPMVPSMGGNAGTQTLTVTVRALAVGELTPSNTLQILWKEIAVGLVNGAVFLVLGALIVALWFRDPYLGLVFGLAMIANLTAAGLAGVTIPLALHRLGFDPAVSSAVFVTTVTDCVGFGAFLGLATLLL
ncbi:magnesium transporter [Benzoatithermus flavus]|uniref:Magnesium transporter MgtE n=1 Tax=Benzoatithermus flavus TaxID=3108223 RepID=A0ABU8XND8_9PROT